MDVLKLKTENDREEMATLFFLVQEQVVLSRLTNRTSEQTNTKRN